MIDSTHSNGTDADERRQRISERAYSIWENEGRPDGAHDDHWVRAQIEIDALTPADPLSSPPS